MQMQRISNKHVSVCTDPLHQVISLRGKNSFSPTLGLEGERPRCTAVQFFLTAILNLCQEFLLRPDLSPIPIFLWRYLVFFFKFKKSRPLRNVLINIFSIFMGHIVVAYTCSGGGALAGFGRPPGRRLTGFGGGRASGRMPRCVVLLKTPRVAALVETCGGPSKRHSG
jgi:hypothetical protein